MNKKIKTIKNYEWLIIVFPNGLRLNIYLSKEIFNKKDKK